MKKFSTSFIVVSGRSSIDLISLKILASLGMAKYLSFRIFFLVYLFGFYASDNAAIYHNAWKTFEFRYN